ncbi:MAG: UDP-N-acetylglucosamine 1-carboxyvinyltransferase [Candidatus Paceibacterota bacterium]|jgi:UDP-N-acetylglucosamine 1-carboxyvinyltransferase
MKHQKKDKTLASLGKLIQNLREERGISQEELAQKIGTTQSAIARLESGSQNISAGTLSKISAALERNLIELSKGRLDVQIQGASPLSGTIQTKTSKNAAVGLLCASLLNRGKTTLRNVPKIEEVNRIIEVLTSLDIKVRWQNSDLEIEPPQNFNIKNFDIEAGTKTRSIIMLIGPLIHFLKKFSLPHVGGCRLGARTIAPHVFALEKLGVKIETKSKEYRISQKKLKPNYIVLYETGDTVTENVLMAAALIPSKTTIRFASANYQVQDVCFFLQALGVKVEGIGTSTLIVHGLKEIKKDVEYSISEDPIDSMFFIAAAATTKSNITITRAPIDFLEIELLKLEKMGFRFKISKRYKARNGETDLVDITTYPSKLTAPPDKIEARPYPGLNIDNLPFFAVIATQARGQTLIHDWVYEERAIYYKELDKLRADTILADPHRLFVNGPTKLKAAEVVCPPALRPAAIILIGMLAAEGTSILRNIYSINRGYEDIVKRLQSLGAKIKILREI